MENAKDQLQDIAGIRIICYFAGDVNNLVNMLKKQPDLIFIRERNYIENPKPNGYRSHHLNFWAAMEHRVSFGYTGENGKRV